MMRGTMRVVGDERTHNINLQQQAPDKYYIWINLVGEGVFERGNNGDIAWERTPREARQLSEAEKVKSAQTFDFYTELNYEKWVTSVQSVSVEGFADQRCDVLELTNHLGEREKVYFSQLNGRKVGMVKDLGAEQERIIRYGQYLERDGIFTAMSIEEKVGSLRKLWIFDSLEWGKTDADFGTPSFIKGPSSSGQ